jgi:hypothetical protein
MKNYLDKSLPIEERKKLFKEAMDKMMNPFDDFDPDNFEPLATENEKPLLTRKRVKPEKELPTFGLKPKEIRVGQMIGEYESKQDLYLTFAHRCNELQKQIDELKKLIK